MCPASSHTSSSFFNALVFVNGDNPPSRFAPIFLLFPGFKRRHGSFWASLGAGSTVSCFLCGSSTRALRSNETVSTIDWSFDFLNATLNRKAPSFASAPIAPLKKLKKKKTRRRRRRRGGGTDAATRGQFRQSSRHLTHPFFSSSSSSSSSSLVVVVLVLVVFLRPPFGARPFFCGE